MADLDPAELKAYHDDDAQLAQMGHKSELKRHFSMLYVLHWLPQIRLEEYQANVISCLDRCWVWHSLFLMYVFTGEL